MIRPSFEIEFITREMSTKVASPISTEQPNKRTILIQSTRRFCFFSVSVYLAMLNSRERVSV